MAVRNSSLADDSLSTAGVRAILDAGGDIDAVLSGLLYRQITTLEAGQILEVISRNPRSHDVIRQWCERTGHTFRTVAEKEDEAVFWIRKTA